MANDLFLLVTVRIAPKMSIAVCEKIRISREKLPKPIVQPLIVVQKDTLLAVRFLEHLVLGSQILDHLLLLTIDPACDNDDIELPRLKYRIHDGSIGVKCVEMIFTIRWSIR